MSLFNPNLGDGEGGVSESILLTALSQEARVDNSQPRPECWIPSPVERVQMQRRNFPEEHNIPPSAPLISTVPLPRLPNETNPRRVNPVLLYQAGDNGAPPDVGVQGIDLLHPSLLSVVSSRIGGAPLHLDRTSVAKPEAPEVMVYHPGLTGAFLVSAANGWDVTVDDLFSSFAKYLEEKVSRVDERGFDTEAGPEVIRLCQWRSKLRQRNESRSSDDFEEKLRRSKVLVRQWLLQGFSWEEETEMLRIWTQDGDLE